MAVWEWFRHVINRAEVLQLILFLLRFLVAAESPGRLKDSNKKYASLFKTELNCKNSRIRI